MSDPVGQNVENLKEVQELSGVFVGDAEDYQGWGGTCA